MVYNVQKLNKITCSLNQPAKTISAEPHDTLLQSVSTLTLLMYVL